MSKHEREFWEIQWKIQSAYPDKQRVTPIQVIVIIALFLLTGFLFLSLFNNVGEICHCENLGLTHKLIHSPK